MSFYTEQLAQAREHRTGRHRDLPTFAFKWVRRRTTSGLICTGAFMAGWSFATMVVLCKA